MYTGSCGKGSITTKNAFGKIKRSVLSLDFEKGGLKIINIENQQKMFLTKWSAKLIREKDTFWAQAVKQLFKPLHSTLNATVPPNYNQAINKVDSHFWRLVS